MTPTETTRLLLWLTREVARLHFVTATLRAVIEEMRVIEPKLDGLPLDQIQRESWQQFYSKLEDLNPEVAAMIDPRTEEQL